MSAMNEDVEVNNVTRFVSGFTAHIDDAQITPTAISQITFFCSTII